MKTKGNMMYVHFYTDVPEPKNGFKAVITSGGKYWINVFYNFYFNIKMFINYLLINNV